MRRVCIAIGISRAEGLIPLSAAATAAEEIGQWAKLSGFAAPEDIQVLTDRKVAVTIELIASTLRRLLPIGKHTDALFLHFAGHGLREDNTRTLWLPTNWRTELRAIAVERLKNRLSDFGIANVTIISDACKALANDKDTSDLTADGILGAGTSAGSRPIFDRFDAVHDVESAFMIPGPTPAQSRCLFSGALIEALWGAKSAIDAHYDGKVTPGSLADYLSKRVAELCEIYQLNCDPQTLPGRPEDHLIYFDESKVDTTIIPALQAWPAPIGVVVIQPAAAEPFEEKLAVDQDIDLSIEDDPQVALGTGRIDGTNKYAKIVREILGPKLGDTNPDITGFERQFVLPDAAHTKLKDWVKTIEEAESLGPSTPSRDELNWLIARARGEVERSLVEAFKDKRRRATATAFSQSEIPMSLDTNLLLGGGRLRAIWSTAPIRQLADDQWHVEIFDSSQQLVVEYEDGIFVPLVLYKGLITTAARDARGTNGWLLRTHYGWDRPDDEAVDILSRMQSGNLSPSQVDEVAAVIRMNKHGNPVLGAICSYLYDYTGDLDSIRRMAYFYTSHYQPIPYDIVLMGELLTTRNGSTVIADVPAVGSRTCKREGLPQFVSDATPQAFGPVGGLCPWLRQGWDFVDTPTDRESALVQGLPDIRKHLLPETFTSFSREGGEMLTSYWEMKSWA